MHYKNGRPAKAGDKVFDLKNGNTGIIYNLNSIAQTCNGRLVKTSDSDPYVTLSDCAHVDDIAVKDRHE